MGDVGDVDDVATTPVGRAGDVEAPVAGLPIALEVPEVPQTAGSAATTPPHAHRAASGRTITSQSTPVMPVKVWSRWRLPANTTELPLYVQRNFRVKTFFLLSVQLTLIFWEMALVHFVLLPQLAIDPRGTQVVFFLLGVFVLGAIFAMHVFQDQHPVNYMMLAASTILVGFFWGVAPMKCFSALDEYVHFQVMGILAVALGFCTLTTAIFTQGCISPRLTMLASYVLSWLLASAIDLYVACYWLRVSSSFWVAISSSFAFCLLIGALAVDVGRLLTKCDPDNFVRIVVAMDTALLVLSLPMLMVSCCLTHIDEADREAVEPQQVQEEGAEMEAGNPPFHGPAAAQQPGGRLAAPRQQTVLA